MAIIFAFARLSATRLATAVVPWIWAATVATAQAQELAGPTEVILYIHSEMKRTDFVERLECALKHVLVAPVSTQDLHLTFSKDLLASPTQLDVQKVANRFIQATKDDSSRTFKYLIVPFDLKDAAHRYVFATSFLNQSASGRVGILSTSRLDTRVPNYPDEQNAEQTAHRLYKLILKSIARLSGLKSPDACVLVFPRNLDELDQKSAEFCPNDRASLVAAKIIKPEHEVGTGCALISQGWMSIIAQR